MNRLAAVVLLAILVPPSALPAEAPHVFAPEIAAADFAAHVKVLAGDDFDGRSPATPGETKTLRYLAEQFQRLGLAPGNGTSYFQKVPLQIRWPDQARSSARFDVAGKAIALALGKQVVLGSDAGLAEVEVAGSPMVFVGYGIDAPEERWNDYAGVDVAGKTVVVLAGEPEGSDGDHDWFEGKRLTFYSRLSYKLEAAARHGASAAVVVHDTVAAGDDWQSVKERWTTEPSLRPEDRPVPPLKVQGWLAPDAARALFAAAGMTLPDASAAAGRRGFTAVAMAGATFSAHLSGKISQYVSHNAIARIVGAGHPDEVVLYTAHWDHLGSNDRRSGDKIFNGALDNASGVATVLEIAERFARDKTPPDRTILFLFPTLEELGLLGSSYYVSHPVVPLAKTVADINFDMVVPIGRTRNFVVVGLGYSELDGVVAPIVSGQGRTLAGEADSSHFFRSDHLSFARAGVPALYMRGGVATGAVSRGRIGRGGGDAAAPNQATTPYHSPDDEFDPRWDLRGIVADIEVSYRVGAALAASRDWPNYRVGSQFRAARDASRAAVSPP